MRKDLKEGGRLGSEAFAYLREEHLSRRNRRCKDPGVRVCLACLGISKEAQVAGAERERGERSERKPEG